MKCIRRKLFNDLKVLSRWESHAPYQSLAVPIGLRGKDDLVYLNLHEKAHGPHGLIAGTTGSGKSETIQSYILSLAVNFHHTMWLSSSSTTRVGEWPTSSRICLTCLGRSQTWMVPSHAGPSLYRMRKSIVGSVSLANMGLTISTNTKRNLNSVSDRTATSPLLDQ